MIPPDMNPNWQVWFAAQPQETQDALSAAWDATADMPGLAAGHRNSSYARREALVKRSAEYGYSPA